jgi:hypothetical protein
MEFKSRNFGNFECCQKVAAKIEFAELEKFADSFAILKNELAVRFSDFTAIREDLQLFYALVMSARPL